MQRPDPIISFRKVTRHDLPLLEAWISQPHWQEWWGDVREEIGFIKAMIEGTDTTRPFIFQLDGKDSGYIQYWTVGDNLVEPWLSQTPWIKLVPPESIGVDMAIADLANISKGIGTKVLNAFIAELRNNGFDEIIIDPSLDNKRAIRAYEKAGFRPIASLLGKTGETYLMRHERQ